MAGPWEKYKKPETSRDIMLGMSSDPEAKAELAGQSAPVGPWSKYQTPTTVNTPKAPQPSLGDEIGRIVSAYKETQFGSPQDLLERLDSLVSKGFNKAGETAVDLMAQEKDIRGNQFNNPNLAAAVGTAIQMAPEGPRAITPGEGGAVIGDRAVKWGQRALGIPKAQLGTDAARAQAETASRVALEKGVIPWLGDADEMGRRALKVKGDAGKILSDMRSAPGPQEIDPVYDRLERLRSELTEGGARGGEWDVIHDAIDRAKATLQGLSGGGFKPTTKRTVSYQGLKEDVVPVKESVQRRGAMGVNSENAVDPLTGVPTRNVQSASVPGDSRSYTGLSREVVPVQESRVEFGGGPRSSVDDQLAGRSGAKKVRLSSVERVKKRINDRINFQKDNANQKDAKAIGGAIEDGVEDILRESGVDIKAYRQAKKEYGAAKTMLRGVDVDKSKAGNNRFGPIASGGGILGMLTTANPGVGLATMLGIDAAKRIGPSATARLLAAMDRTPSLTKSPILQLLASIEGRNRR